VLFAGWHGRLVLANQLIIRQSWHVPWESLGVHLKSMYIGFTAYSAQLKNCRFLSCLAYIGDSRLIPSFVDPARCRVSPETARHYIF